MPEKIESHKKIWGTPFPIGGEWDAGYTPSRPGNPGGLVFVRRTKSAFEVVYRQFQMNGGSVERVVRVFRVGNNPDEAEVEAKQFALDYRDQQGR